MDVVSGTLQMEHECHSTHRNRRATAIRVKNIPGFNGRHFSLFTLDLAVDLVCLVLLVYLVGLVFLVRYIYGSIRVNQLILS